MAIKFYDRKTGKIYIRKPKLLYIGRIKNKENNSYLSEEDKIKISNFVDNIEYLGIEFGAKTIVSTSEHDIFKIRNEVKNNNKLINKINIKRIKSKKNSTGLDIIKNQLGLHD